MIKQNMLGTLFLSESSSIIEPLDFTYGLEEWVSGKKKLLSVMGIGGSGKTYMSKLLAEKYNAKFIELDLLFLELRRIYGEEMIGFKRNPEFTNKKFKEFIDKELKQNKRVIIEGVHLRAIDINYICKGAVIIKNTDIKVATDRAYSRQQDSNRQSNFGNKLTREEWLLRNIEGQKQVDAFRANVEKNYK